ncbi:unnamed protein product [Arctia plantaginis]|uniref:Uncharacterized protein n=1 Tax=Arctia plantaginis TaxID=874455 RepID=A0A8S1A3V5_ARCPL|nr:unnamed protein product [Arctia plantaginis]CAB3239154.1 unnamed protein product [Arctia plantaginis]
MSEFFGPWSNKGDDDDAEVVEETVETVTTTTRTRKRSAVSQQQPQICLVTYGTNKTQYRHLVAFRCRCLTGEKNIFKALHI